MKNAKLIAAVITLLVVGILTWMGYLINIGSDIPRIVLLVLTGCVFVAFIYYMIYKMIE